MLFFLIGCLSFENQYSLDHDGDGFTEYDGDCDDSNFNIGPEECRDDDGDGQRELDGDCDDTDPKVYLRYLEKEDETGCFVDNDGDGFGDANLSDLSNEELVGVTAGSDCDDSNGSINPDKEEICDENFVDENCNGLINNEDIENLSTVSTTTYYEDSDGDGFGIESETIQYCGFRVSDENASENEDATEEQLIEGYVSNTVFDCDDNDPEIHPNAKERCDSNNIDENCNGLVNDDDENLDPDSQTMYYLDVDGDGFGRLFDSVFSCEKPDGYVDNNLDCQDEITLDVGTHTLIGAEIHPNAQEVCDDYFVDEDCDGLINNNDPNISSLTSADTDLIAATNASVFSSDRDNDNYGLVDSSHPLIVSCIELPDTTPYDENAQMDCDDLEPVVYPGAVEVCDGLDNDCDTLVDDDDEVTDDLLSSGTIFYLDADGDGFGDFSNSSRRCATGDSYVAQNSDGFDCNDEDEFVNPSANEICDDNDIDEDCDGLSDDLDPSALSKTTFYIDADLDGFGNPNRPQEYCDLRIGVSTNANDCNDQSFQINPEANEICDSIDNDCDTLVDDLDDDVLEGSRNTYYLDSDRDGYGVIPDSENNVGVEYACSLIPGYSVLSGDCDDNNPTISEGSQEICDGTDNDCDGSIPDNERDFDRDGFVSCTFIPINNEDGSIKGGDDCNDNPLLGPNIYPSAEEICDGVYNDCNNPNWNNNAPENEQDSDEDGYIACSLDITLDEWNLRNNFILGSNDCDDSNIEVLSEDLDRDCDGYLDIIDCAATDPILPSIDGDCDGIPTDSDCDDNNIFAGTLPQDYDTDCDGKPEQMLSLGLNHTCLLDSFGQLYCFGDNSVGQINTPSDQTFLQVASGDQHTCAITTDQNILCWGLNDSLQAQPPVGSYTYITSGSDFSCALDENNYASCWGNISSGRGNVPSVPLQSMAAGNDHICGIDYESNLHCWGNNENGQISHPVGEFVNVDSGDGFSCAISNNKQVQCWGNFLVFVSEFLDDISAGPEHLCVLNILGQTTCYGNIDFATDKELVEIDSGSDHACGIDEDLNVWCWGANQYLQSRTDFDADGTTFQNDCDDSNPQGQSLFFDDDCDGALREVDCDDFDANVGSIENDNDCDGVIATNENDEAVDCDDNDILLGDINLDTDCDGIVSELDCDDNLSNDGDCDGVTTELDCDDNNPFLLEFALDEDCDGTPATDALGNALDCDDKNNLLGSSLLDNDCDGVIAIDENGEITDCDDNDFYKRDIDSDADCDGVTTELDCDDNNASDFEIAGDCDEDGFVVDIDCDDNNPTGTIVWEDVDCDGITTEEDCDDSNPNLGSLDNDSDCDGIVFGEDCDDTNILFGSVNSDEDCDGIVDDIDLDKDGDGLCDLTESNIDGDADCDGVLAVDDNGETVDCDDNDILLGDINLDADCDGIISELDCDDNLSNDGDCDGVTTELDCDDNNVELTAVLTDADCDGVVIDDDCDDSSSMFGNIDQDWDCDGYVQADDCNDYFHDMTNDCLLPTQVSFGIRGTWNESNQTLFPTALHGYFGEDGNPNQEDVSIDIWLMDDAYSLATTEEERQAHLCHITADYTYEAGSFALTLADGSLLSDSWASFDGNILYYEELLSERCQSMHTSIFPTGQPEMFQNFRVGIAFAPLSETLTNTASALFNEYWPIHQSYYFSQYLFVEMFDEDNNQVSFVGTDFSYSAIYQVDSNRALVMDIDDFSPIRIPAETSPHIGYVEGILGNTMPIQNILDSN